MVAPKTKLSDWNYDSGMGVPVPELERDETIPIIAKINGTEWSIIRTVNGQEERLKNWLNSLNIPTYLPVIKEKSGRTTPIFSACVFAALTAEQNKTIADNLLVTELQNPDEDTLVAELLSVSMAEQISRYIPFSYEKNMPEKLERGETKTPCKFNDIAEFYIIGNEKTEETKLFFCFQTLNKILKFDMTTYMFRALLLSKFLFANKYCA